MSGELRNTKGTRLSDAEVELVIDVLRDENTRRRLPMSFGALLRVLILEGAAQRGFKPKAPRERAR